MPTQTPTTVTADPTVGAHRDAPSPKGNAPSSSRGGPKTSEGKGGPKTPEGKAVSSRNATSHGLFARHAVLPHLGEDPAEYESLLRHLFDQVRPRNLMERQYLELWAEASWKLRRLSRLEADVWEDGTLTLAERLSQLERLDRLQSSLRRKMDKAVHMLGPDLPRLFATRTREDLMDHLGLTPTLCAGHPFRERDLEEAVRAHRTYPDPTETDPLLTDEVPAHTEATPKTENCENEPSPPSRPTSEAAEPPAPSPSPACGRGVAEGRGEGIPSEAPPETKNRENEPSIVPSVMSGSHWPLSLSALRVASAEGGGVPDEGGVGANPPGTIPPQSPLQQCEHGILR